MSTLTTRVRLKENEDGIVDDIDDHKISIIDVSIVIIYCRHGCLML